MIFTSLLPGGRPDDWFSPILIKELRQGMRARAFVLSFLLIQLCLIVLVLGNVAAQNDRMALDNQNSFFWIIVGFALLLFMPLRALNSVSQEVRNHTMETILLTRLTAWRVVFGKWTALFAQSFLFVSAVLPYVVLRYFIGGDDVVSDFEWIFFMLWLSGLLIAAALALSALANAAVQIIFLLSAFFLTTAFSGVLDSGLPSFTGSWQVLGSLLLFGIFIPALLFEIAASSFAPAAENHALRRRLLGFLLFAFAFGLARTTDETFVAGLFLALMILIGVCYFDLVEKPKLLPRMIQPFLRAGWLGRIAGIFLLPGWPSALLFSLVVIPSAIYLEYLFAPQTYSMPHLLSVSLFIFAVLGSVLPPALICHLFWPKLKQVLLMVFIYNAILLGLAPILKGFAELTHSGVDGILAFLPGIPVYLILINDPAQKELLSRCLVGNEITLGLVFVVLFAAGSRYFRSLDAFFRSTPAPSPAPSERERAS